MQYPSRNHNYQVMSLSLLPHHRQNYLVFLSTLVKECLTLFRMRSKKKNKKSKAPHNKMLMRVSFIIAVIKFDFRPTNGDWPK